MKKNTIDCCSLPCPEPVLKTRALLEQDRVDEVEVMVDNVAAVENISRFLEFQGFSVSVESDGARSRVLGKRNPSSDSHPGTDPASEAARPGPGRQKILLMVSSQTIGKGDDELGGKLMVNFFKTLEELGDDLWRVILVNHGVRFATRDSILLDVLLSLEVSGVSILVCGTCLSHLQLMDEKRVGQTTNMLDIVTSIQLADKMISF